MHPRAWRYVAARLAEAEHELDRADVAVVEFGGSIRTDGYALRRLLPWCAWTSIDLEGDADVKGDAATWGEGGSADVVVATELLEHAHDGAGIVANARRLLRPGGLFVATMAGPTRSAHGATGAPEPADGEFYRNVEPWMLAEWLSAARFDGYSIDLTGDLLDLRCTAHVAR